MKRFIAGAIVGALTMAALASGRSFVEHTLSGLNISLFETRAGVEGQVNFMTGSSGGRSLGSESFRLSTVLDPIAFTRCGRCFADTRDALYASLAIPTPLPTVTPTQTPVETRTPVPTNTPLPRGRRE